MGKPIKIRGAPDRTLSGDEAASILSADLGQRNDYHQQMDNEDKQEVREAFAVRLKEAMADRGITGSLRSRASALGLPKTTLEGLENASKLPGRARSLLIAQKLGVTEQWLMTGQGPKVESLVGGPIPIAHMTPEEQAAILAVWRSFQSKYEDPPA